MDTLTEIRLSYSIGMKVNIGNYESVDVHISQSETHDVSETEADPLRQERYLLLKEDVDRKLIESVAEIRDTFRR